MRSYIITLLTILFCLSDVAIQSQDFGSGYFVVPNDAITSSAQEQLGNKVKVALSRAGLAATDGFFPMVTVVKYDELETIEIPGMRTMYKTSGTVTLLMTFSNTNTALSATEFSVDGIGVSKEVSQKTAINNIQMPADKLKDMAEKAKKNYASSMESYASNRLAEAKKMKASKDYYSALSALSEIPKGTKPYLDAQKMYPELEKLVQIESDTEAKAQAIREDREHDLAKDKMKYDSEKQIEQQKTLRTSIESRARVDERYYQMWNSYYKSYY